MSTFTITFKANGKLWETDEHTYTLMKEFRTEKNDEILGFIFYVGQEWGRIRKKEEEA